jgi:hypothetical protein
MAIEIVDLPIKNRGSFHSYVNVYQRVRRTIRITILIHPHPSSKFRWPWIHGKPKGYFGALPPWTPWPGEVPPLVHGFGGFPAIDLDI